MSSRSSLGASRQASGPACLPAWAARAGCSPGGGLRHNSLTRRRSSTAAGVQRAACTVLAPAPGRGGGRRLPRGQAGAKQPRRGRRAPVPRHGGHAHGRGHGRTGPYLSDRTGLSVRASTTAGTSISTTGNWYAWWSGFRPEHSLRHGHVAVVEARVHHGCRLNTYTFVLAARAIHVALALALALVPPRPPLPLSRG